MAKVFGPALSIDAKGKVGKGVAFQRRPGGAALTKNPVPSRKSLDDPSPAKQAQRNLIKQWVEEWQALPAIKREYWSNVAEELGTELSGYHQFMKAKGIATMPVSRLRNYWPEMMQGLVGYWAFDSDGEDVAKDLSGQGNDGILKPSYPDNCPLWVPGKSSEAGKALSFDGLDDYVEITVTEGGPLDLRGGNKFTIGMWIKLSDTTRRNIFLAYYNAYPILFEVNSSAQPRITVKNKAGIDVVLTTGTVTQDEWTFLTATHDGSTIRVYKNGGFLDSIACDGIGGTFGSYLDIGIYNRGSYSTIGKIDDVRIYNRALTADEILDLYNLLK